MRQVSQTRLSWRAANFLYCERTQLRKQYLHLSVYVCDQCNGPAVSGSLAVRENEISKETEIRAVGERYAWHAATGNIMEGLRISPDTFFRLNGNLPMFRSSATLRPRSNCNRLGADRHQYSILTRSRLTS